MLRWALLLLRTSGWQVDGAGSAYIASPGWERDLLGYARLLSSWSASAAAGESLHLSELTSSICEMVTITFPHLMGGGKGACARMNKCLQSTLGAVCLWRCCSEEPALMLSTLFLPGWVAPCSEVSSSKHSPQSQQAWMRANEIMPQERNRSEVTLSEDSVCYQ